MKEDTGAIVLETLHNTCFPTKHCMFVLHNFCSVPLGVKSSQSDLDAVVKNLASALVAEIKKMNSASSSSASSSSKGGKHLPSPTTAAGRRSSISASLLSYSPMVKKAVSSLFKSKPILQKSGEGSSKKMKVGVYVCVRD